MGEEDFGPREGGNWNTFNRIREALGLKQEQEFLTEFLHWWTTLTREEHHKYRTIDLEKVQDYDLPRPPEELKRYATE